MGAQRRAAGVGGRPIGGPLAQGAVDGSESLRKSLVGHLEPELVGAGRRVRQFSCGGHQSPAEVWRAATARWSAAGTRCRYERAIDHRHSRVGRRRVLWLAPTILAQNRTRLPLTARSCFCPGAYMGWNTTALDCPTRDGGHRGPGPAWRRARSVTADLPRLPPGPRQLRQPAPRRLGSATHASLVGDLRIRVCTPPGAEDRSRQSSYGHTGGNCPSCVGDWIRDTEGLHRH